MRNKYFRPYLILCFIAAILFQVAVFYWYGFSWDIRLVIFLVLLLINASHEVTVENSSFSINYPLLFPIIAYFGLGWGSLFASIGLIAKDEFEDHWAVFLYNRGSLGLAAGISGLGFFALGGVENFVTSLVFAAFTYSAVNLSLFYCGKYLQGNREPTFQLVIESLKTMLPSMAMAAMFFYIFDAYDIFGVIVAYYLFITIRSGLLFGHLEANFRVGLIKSLLRAVSAKDHDLMQHLESVAHYTKRLAKKCNYPLWKLQILDEASYLHDIGKLEIPDYILKKKSTLTGDEYKEIKNHPERGRQFLEEIPLPRTHKEIVANIALYHHERYDGTGYPNGLKGEDIPIEARIVAVADTWDAMTGKRCYREPMPTSDAIAELRRVKGTQLDPSLVESFIEIIEGDMGKGLLAEPLAASTSE